MKISGLTKEQKNGEIEIELKGLYMYNYNMKVDCYN